jgi:putative addiction module CopG family antidote
MATKTIHISLPDELEASIEARVRSGLYGDAGEVVRAGLRALAREELGLSLGQFQEIMSALPQDPITPEIEQEGERSIREAREADSGKTRQ